ncbi:MAG: corrinoid protein [Deltaproteobacteria bacterium]|jgi:corrinoid protein of di/trimethylamine methyltransferase|nr:corrinoid protein [Deltaproteobacteria bacterium]MBW2470364.1 corrinoid protein [Deltaproteobacteria bacterium]MBW2488208.1 corrinoid protein [Deltaproteobacteria bacterium]MBW2515364.1 corrinoid protein [Deltaproteobacteria bacterium]
MSELFGKMAELLIAGKVDEVSSLTKEAVDGGLSPQDILEQGLLAGMDVVGQRFKANEMFIPEVLRCAKCMHGAMEILRPLLVESGVKTAGTLVIGTVKGDLHDIGKNLVGMMFEGAGFKVIDLGIDKDPQAFVDALKEHKAELFGMSALLTTTMPKMGETINAIKEAGIRDQVKIMIGGAPVTAEFAKEIGADAYASNAASAVDKGKELLGL